MEGDCIVGLLALGESCEFDELFDGGEIEEGDANFVSPLWLSDFWIIVL
jgi:hypothetical protein